MSKALLFSLDIWQKAMKNLDRRLQVMFIVASSLSNDLRNGGGGATIVYWFIYYNRIEMNLAVNGPHVVLMQIYKSRQMRGHVTEEKH